MYKQFFRQLVRRYGEKEISTWRYEVGIEGFHSDYDDFFGGDGYDFVDVYEFIAKAVKDVCPDAKVGYASGASVENQKFFDATIKKLYESKYAPDFISAIIFPYIPKQIVGLNGEKAGFVRSKDKEFEGNELKLLYDAFDRLGISRDKLVIAEWNLTCSNQNYLNDSSFRGCLLLRDIVNYASDLDVWGLWIATDWQCNSFSSRSVINGGGGLVSKDTIRKPIFYALKMMNYLGSKVVARGENYIVTRTVDDEYQIMCFNTVWYNSSYFIDAENQSTVEDAKAYFDMKADKKIIIKLEGVSENAGYYVKRRSVNRDHGSIIDEWDKFGNDSNLDRIDIKYLQEMCVPEHSRMHCKSKGNILTIEVELQAEEFCMLDVFPEY